MLLGNFCHNPTSTTTRSYQTKVGVEKKTTSIKKKTSKNHNKRPHHNQMLSLLLSFFIELNLHFTPFLRI